MELVIMVNVKVIKLLLLIFCIICVLIRVGKLMVKVYIVELIIKILMLILSMCICLNRLFNLLYIGNMVVVVSK